jgi:hypothetical protein
MTSVTDLNRSRYETFRCPRCEAEKPRSAFGGRTRRAHYCKPCTNATAREWRQRNKTLHARNQRRYFLGRNGLTEATYEELREAQDGKCAICGTVPNGDLAVDHDHETGIIRGLLCTRCNAGLGYFKDDRTALRRAANYLTRPPAASRGWLFGRRS